MKTGRTVHHVLAEWRAVERRLEREDLNGERNALEARSRVLRTEYQARASGEMRSDSAVASPDPRTA